MKSILSGLFALACVAAAPAAETLRDTKCYEMRVYYAPEGKLDALQARFRDHTCKLFEKHGMVNVGYWVPTDNPDNRLIYLLAHSSREACDKSWKAFIADPEWQKVHKASETGGKLVDKIDRVFLTVTDYSPEIKIGQAGPRVFELRTYTASPGNLGHLNARFRDHTCRLFAKHGITNIGYWTPMPDQKGAEDTLIYLLAHTSREAAKASFEAFGKDSDWVAARKASEEKAGGSLTVKDGVKSVFLMATDYSPMK